jgi:hypothetical protein
MRAFNPFSYHFVHRVSCTAPPPYQYQHTNPTPVHKVTYVPVFYMALGLNDFDGGKSNTRAIGGVSLKISTFLGAKKQLASLTAISGPKKLS